MYPTFQCYFLSKHVSFNFTSDQSTMMFISRMSCTRCYQILSPKKPAAFKESPSSYGVLSPAINLNSEQVHKPQSNRLRMRVSVPGGSCPAVCIVRLVFNDLGIESSEIQALYICIHKHLIVSDEPVSPV